MNPLPIEEFIRVFKKGFNEDELIKVFTQGNCYHFAVILDDIYDGNIMYDEINGHFMFKYEDSYYDIRGEVKNVEHIQYLWKIRKNDELLYQRILRDCVYKIG